MANFMDLNVQSTEKHVLAKTLAVAARLGYDVVAVNHVAPNLDNTMRKKKKAKDYQAIPSPDDLKVNPEEFTSLKRGRKTLKQVSRFSTVIENAGQLHKLNTTEVQDFDLIAVTPMSEKMFQIAVSTMKIDIITIDVTQKLPFAIKRPLVNVALERGIYFEIQYSPAIRDSTYRGYMIANAQSLMRFCKGKNVIITSGCQKAMELRGPHDAANLGLLFGMSQEQAKAALSSNCQSLLLHSESRKIVKSTIGVIKTSELEEKDKWILKQTVVNGEQQQSESELNVNDIKKESINSKDDNKLLKRVHEGEPVDKSDVKKLKFDTNKVTSSVNSNLTIK